MVPENIHTPTAEGIGNSRGVGGSMAQEIPEGRRGEFLIPCLSCQVFAQRSSITPSRLSSLRNCFALVQWAHFWLSVYN